MTATFQQTAATTSVATWLSEFGKALAAADGDAVAALFTEDGFWRDLIAFTWNITTLEGRPAIADMVAATVSSVAPYGIKISDGEQPAEADGVIEAWIDFETAVGRGHGQLRLRDGRCWTLLTTLYELKGHEEASGPDRPRGTRHGAYRDRASWLDEREVEAAVLGVVEQPYVLIVGGGQAGIALGARLRQLRVPTIIVDKRGRPGDQWRSRYKSLCLHDPVWYDHLPYLKFPANWPIFSPKDKIADWLESYTKIMELNYWANSEVTNASYDAQAGQWTVRLERDGRPFVLRPAQLVLATGMSGRPSLPSFPGMDSFRGDQHHSSAHPGPAAYRGKRCVVIGSNNSAFDICGALWENDADVTMVQRSSTHIVKSATLMDIGLKALYSEEAVAGGITTEKADMIFASIPYRLLAGFQIPLYDAMRERDKDFYDRLEAAGFRHDWGEDGSGLFMKYLRRGSGYYIDVGAADLVADGEVKLAQGQVDHLTSSSVVLEDGTELPADLVVYATGYASMNGWAAELISQEVADRVGKCWGLGSGTAKDPGPWEGEERNMWKPTQQEALWFHGGNLHQSRHYSLYLALQLKARQAGIPTPVYGVAEVHHRG
ncbi:MAG TPA: NAD(P)/FAD-dependent oxidoreductase [Streptosporangiaceae bacterium]|jgi:putative flavoprotein involved in K+ transport